MLLNAWTKPLIALSAIGTLTSCAHETPPQPASFSGQIRDVAHEQKVADCDVLKPEPIPSISQQLIDTLPEKLEGETEYGYEARLNPQEKAVYAWFQVAIRNGKRWQVFCMT